MSRHSSPICRAHTAERNLHTPSIVMCAFLHVVLTLDAGMHTSSHPLTHSRTRSSLINPWTPMTDSCVHVPVQSVSCRWECLLFPAMCMWAPFENEVGVRISASPFKHIVITCFEYKCTYLCWHRRWLRPLWRTSLKQIRVHIESTFEMNLRDIRVIAVSRLREIHITVIAIVLEWW